MNFQAPYCLCKIKQSPHVRPLHPGPSEWSPHTELHHPSQWYVFLEVGPILERASGHDLDFTAPD